MTQNITVAGASYSNVPAVTLPKTGGGTARFDDTSDANATASDIMSGKTAYVNGSKITGTATSGGGGSVTQDENGYIVLPDTGGGTPAPTPSAASLSDPIRFFDYDGTLIASYTAVPSALPSVPTHTGLTNGAWNYNIQQITTQFNAMGTCDVGANYETSSGATEIDVEFVDSTRLHPYLALAVKGEVSIDWGDSSTSDTVTGTSLTSRKSSIHHEYAQTGKYTIKITRTSGDGYSLYCSSQFSLLNKNSGTNANRIYSNCVKAVRVGAYCSIGTYAFSSCYSLASVSFPSSVTSIDASAFYYCYSLASVSIPSSVTSIGNNAFNGCHHLASVSIPSGATSIGTGVFQSCYSLASVSIPSGVTSIGASTFSSCSSLASLTIPNGVTSIGTSAFSSCSSLASLTIPSGVTSIGASTFNYCYSLLSVSIPSNVTSIENNTFNYCYSLTSVSISNNVTSIGNAAFTNCYSLASVSIPNKVTSIGNTAFSGCYSLASVSIPSSVTSIGNSAFSGCYGMKEYHFTRTESVPTLGTTAFNNIQSDCIIYVPSSKLNDYKTAENWTTYADYMVGE